MRPALESVAREVGPGVVILLALLEGCHDRVEQVANRIELTLFSQINVIG